LPLITLDQAELNLNHQFNPSLSYQGMLAQAIFSDQNRRLALYQALRWQAVSGPACTWTSPELLSGGVPPAPGALFQPPRLHALGVTLDFDGSCRTCPCSPRFLAILPTLVLQTTAQMVGNDGRWGPALSTLAGLEAEPIQNLYVGLHYFYFKEWATNYWFNSLIFGLQWRF